MKKFLAIMFALIFALSCATTAFAADLTCPYCNEAISSEKAYNEHISKKCPVLFADNKGDILYYCDYTEYGCSAYFKSEAEYKKHIEICPFKKTTWGDKVEAFFLDLDYSDFTEILGKVTDALKGIGLPGLLIKVIDLLEQGVTALIGELK